MRIFLLNNYNNFTDELGKIVLDIVNKVLSVWNHEGNEEFKWNKFDFGK